MTVRHICNYLFPPPSLLKSKYVSFGWLHPGVKGDATPSTRSFTTQSVWISVDEILCKAIPVIGVIFPGYTPILSVLIFGCAALAVRLPLALDPNGSKSGVAL
jgi:hypothetical protein